MRQSSLCCVAQLLEMIDEPFEVHLVVYVEPAPEVTTYDHAAEPQVFGGLDVVDAHATKCIHMAVDEATTRRLHKLSGREGLLLVLVFYAVEYVFEKHVLRLFLHHFQCGEVVTRARDIALVAFGNIFCWVVYVYASQPKLAFQIVMIMYGDLVVMLFGQ